MSIKEAIELKDRPTRCKDMIAKLKATGSACIVQLECEVNRSKYILGDCQRNIACDIAGSRHIGSDDAVEQLKAASSHKKNRLTEEVQSRKEQPREGRAASTMSSSML